MKKSALAIVAFMVLLVASLACSLFTGGSDEMSLENLSMAFDENGDNLTTEFSQSDIFYLVGDLQNAPAGTVVRTEWRAVQIDGYGPDELIYEQAISDFTEESFSGIIYFQLSNDSGWITGEYKADVYLDSEFVQSVPFSVR